MMASLLTADVAVVLCMMAMLCSTSVPMCADVRTDCATSSNTCNEKWMKEGCSKTCRECTDAETEQPDTRDDTTTTAATWGEWSQWTECSATCGSGTTTQSRTCMSPHGTCQGSGTNTVTCTLQACCVPRHGTWSDWNEWSPCSRSCGRGSRTRQRTCSAHNECGRPCEGSNTQNGACNTQACPSAPEITTTPNTQPFSAGDNVTLTCRSTNTGEALDGLSWSYSPGDIGRQRRFSYSIQLQISSLSLEQDGTNVTCRDRGGAEEKQTSLVLRVDQKAILGVCNASVNSDNWTIAGFCDVTKVYDSSGQYLCVWEEENTNYPQYSISPFWQMSSSDGWKLQKGNCSFLTNIPAPFLRGSRHIEELKFRANIGPGSTLSDYVTVPVAYPETPTVMCPGKYRIDLPEEAPFECTCQTHSLGTPVGRLLLMVNGLLEATGSVGETSIRLSRNIRLEDKWARVTCLVDWAENVTAGNEPQVFVKDDPAWGEWNSWSACSATCGHGRHTGQRTCYPTGSSCQGSNTETASCKVADCCDVLPSTPKLTVDSSPLRASHTVGLKDTVNFKCDLNPVSCSTLQLYKMAGSEAQIVSNKTTSSPLSLDLTVTSCEDAGIYYCLAENKMAQTNSSTVHLHIYCAPRLINNTEITAEVVEGSKGQFTFDLVAYPLPSVDTFTYRTENSTSPSQQEPVRSGLLSGMCEGHAYALHLVTCKVNITGAASNDDGLYSLQVRNAEGQQSVIFRVSVTPQETNSSSSISFLGITIAVLFLVFVAASIVFMIKRRKGATKERTGNKRNVSDTAASGVNADEPTYCNVTTQSVMSACISDNNIYINIEKNTSTKDSSEPGTSKGPDEDTQNVLYATVHKSRKPSSADNTEKSAKPAGCKRQENGGNGLLAQGGGVENVLNNNEAGSSDSQKATANEEGLFYMEVDFSQYRPEMQRPLPQQEETFHAAVDLQKTAALRT